ncbi:MAG TPA: hypothetical protein VJ461_05160 [Candidatus Nanoarchaeia archaeon]|nr:hypothetical protein [Candidatus Nanoarchaeia archaeon]
MNRFGKSFLASIGILFVFIGLLPASIATNCWSNGENRGWMDNSNQTGPDGATKSCEAKLHTCFSGSTSGGVSAIPCTVDSFMGCNQACSSVETNVACDPTVCLNRCLAARVPGYADTCD